MTYSIISLGDVFQLTTSQGGRRIMFICVALNEYFNSRPRKEVDGYDYDGDGTYKQFQLTTSQGGRHTENYNLNRDKIFQLTTSQGGRQAQIYKLKQEQLFQLTTSQGGRRSFLASDTGDYYISTHDLARRSTAGSCGK